MTLRAVVVDASVYVADAVIGEASHAAASGFLVAAARRGVDFYLPSIAMPEVAAAVARVVGDGTLAIEATKLYRAWPRTHVVPVDAWLSERTVEVAATRRIRGCDAIYVALAQHLGITLVSLDHEQRERAPEDVTALTPAAALLRLTG